MLIDNLILIIPALLAGILVILTHVPLGIEVLKRNIIFIDLAIAQIAGFGFLLAHILINDFFGFEIDLAIYVALAFSLFAAYLFLLVEKKLPQLQEAIIGSSFVIISSLILLISSKYSHGKEEIENILAGEILFVSYKDIAIMALVYAALIFCRFYLKAEKYFYFIFAVTITISVKIIGVYLVFANLIMPAIAVYKISDQKQKLIFAYLASFISLFLGIIMSIIFDLTTSPMIVILLALNGFIFYKISAMKKLQHQ